MKKLYHTLAYNFENIVFIFIGIGFFGFDLAYKFLPHFLKSIIKFFLKIQRYGCNVIHLFIFGYKHCPLFNGVGYFRNPQFLSSEKQNHTNL